MNADEHVSPAKSGEALSTSRSLLARLRADDGLAWERLVHLYTPLVYHWCRKMGLPEQELPDLFQEIFQAVAAHIHNFKKERPSDTFRGWLRTITRNKTYDYFRRRQKQPQAAGGTEANLRLEQAPAPAEEDDEDADADQREYLQLYQQALELIREHFAEHTWRAFWGVVVEGKSTAEVAQELSMRPGTVRVAKSRVLQRLRQELGDLAD